MSTNYIKPIVFTKLFFTKTKNGLGVPKYLAPILESYYHQLIKSCLDIIIYDSVKILILTVLNQYNNNYTVIFEICDYILISHY